MNDQDFRMHRQNVENRRMSNISTTHRSRSILLNKLATQKKINDDFDNREYRLVTGGDDGHVFFWNIPYDFINEAKAHQAQVSGERKLVNPRPLNNRGAAAKFMSSV